MFPSKAREYWYGCWNHEQNGGETLYKGVFGPSISDRIRRIPPLYHRKTFSIPACIVTRNSSSLYVVQSFGKLKPISIPINNELTKMNYLWIFVCVKIFLNIANFFKIFISVHYPKFEFWKVPCQEIRRSFRFQIFLTSGVWGDDRRFKPSKLSWTPKSFESVNIF